MSSSIWQACVSAAVILKAGVFTEISSSDAEIKINDGEVLLQYTQVFKNSSRIAMGVLSIREYEEQAHNRLPTYTMYIQGPLPIPSTTLQISCTVKLSSKPLL